MADVDHNAAKSKLMQILSAKKTGGPVPPVAPGAAAVPQVKKTSSKPTQRVTLSKPSVTLRGSVLIVEPVQRIAQALQSLLKTLRLRVEIAENGAQALELVKTSEFNIVFVDRQLPDIAGFNLCTKIRVTPNGRAMAIIITGEDRDPGMKDQALMVDANDYLPKPLNTKEVTEVVDRFLRPDAAGQAEQGA